MRPACLCHDRRAAGTGLTLPPCGATILGPLSLVTCQGTLDVDETVERKPDAALRAARALSKAVFGGAGYRVEIGAAVGEQEYKAVNAADLAEQLGLARQSVNQELKVLERAGLLTRPDQLEGRKVFLVREKSSYWEWCIEARANAIEMLERQERY